jgi:hypothetical protein
MRPKLIAIMSKGSTFSIRNGIDRCAAGEHEFSPLHKRSRCHGIK